MEDLKSSLRYVSFGFELVGTLALPAALAYYIDISFGDAAISWIFSVGLLFGLIACYFRLKTIINVINQDTTTKKKDF